MGRGIAVLFHDRGTRRGWVVSSTPRPHFTPGKDPVPILQEAGWAPGPVWSGGKSRPHRDSIPDRPARSQLLYRLSYPAHIYFYVPGNYWRTIHFHKWQSGGKEETFWLILNWITEPSLSNTPWVSASYNNRCLELNKQTLKRWRNNVQRNRNSTHQGSDTVSPTQNANPCTSCDPLCTSSKPSGSDSLPRYSWCHASGIPETINLHIYQDTHGLMCGKNHRMSCCLWC